MEDRIYIISAAVGILLFITFLLWRLKKLSDLFTAITVDTLKRNGKWSRTSLTMATAWAMCMISYVYDFIKNGLNLEAFGIFVGVALGAKVADAWSKKLDPLVQPPKDNEPKENIDEPKI